MNDYEKTFVLKMGRLRRNGIEFEEVAKEALTGKFGGATDVLLRDLSPAALKEPERFADELWNIFGRGAMGFCEPIIRYVDLGLYSRKEYSPVAGLIHQLGPPTGDDSDPKGVPLHDHRVKDEQGNHPDNVS